ncbi:beta-hexosaminidase 3 [Selaginella moellendorffii]|uniref:beta-hexosaminidase 3 n=1 Tax=Selaginella moellendorffii TaxID=88036 RepID=UPI000D1C248A|nr:beta-hexosaminidase 3 [Selaginella moellendorffii]|eukprot:XP_024543670.1 beta-hexosaminidase 3 [Selaginella moellendorffii]
MLWSSKRLRKIFVIGILALILSSIVTNTYWSKRSKSSFWHVASSITLTNWDDRSSNTSVLIWPAPRNLSQGSILMTLSRQFSISFSSAAGENLEVLQAGIDRYTSLILRQRKLKTPAKIDPEKFVLDELCIDLKSFNQSLHLGVDESYRLQIPDPLNSKAALLQARTVYGALRGLETFSQICSYDVLAREILVQDCPWDILDEPRFFYRGLLIDTARHYLPLKTIENVIDSMAYAKLNVLHWHVVDEESFPLEIPSFPELWKGSFSITQRYNLDDAKAIVEYARLRGVHVMPEIDVPGHARSWGVGYPELWPSESCTTPLDISKEFTFEVIDGIFSDLSKVFPFELLHIGGDEVDTSCWQIARPTNNWLVEHNFTAAEAYEFFVLQVQKLAMKHGYVPVNWQEPFEKFGQSLSRKTIVHNWWGPQIAPDVVESGLKCIVSEQSSWYLDHIEIPWEKFYSKEPFDNVTSEIEQELIIGGEVCMWGEQVDASNIQQKIWPRAAAAAERLWSPSKVTSLGPENAAPRLEFFRSLLNERGIAASPLHPQQRRDSLQPPDLPDSSSTMVNLSMDTDQRIGSEEIDQNFSTDHALAPSAIEEALVSGADFSPGFSSFK